MANEQDKTELPDNEEPKVEKATFGIKTSRAQLTLISSTAKAAKRKREENRRAAAEAALLKALDDELGPKGGSNTRQDEGK